MQYGLEQRICLGGDVLKEDKSEEKKEGSETWISSSNFNID